MLRNCDTPSVYGDLAQLLPDVYKPAKPRHNKIVIVPHYVDYEIMQVDDSAFRTANVQSSDLFEEIELIAGAELVVSSSLHGLIIAEAYGVPAIWVEASSNVLGSGFKFRDYYAATGRDVGPVRWSAEMRFLGAEPSLPTMRGTEELRAAVGQFRTAYSRRVADESRDSV
jgi:hypothetical protein